MDKLSIEFISVMGMPPVPFVELAADLGCSHVTTSLQSMRQGPIDYPDWSLRDAGLRRDTAAALRDRGVTLSAEGFLIQAGVDMRPTWTADLALFAELSATSLNCVSLEPDQARAADELGALTELAAGFGLKTNIEFVPCFALADLATAVAAVRHVGRPDCALMIDTMHVGRSGVTAADLAALDPAMVGHIQLCDAPLRPVIPDYMEEAMWERDVPGEGELPLAEMLAALPRGRIVGLEIPRRAEAQAGAEPRAWLERSVAAMRELLARRDAAAGA
jgi:sugar phosphate isomerase/epimerase